ncbi:antibiotic biosynthesis monooxygenase family protein [Palleronia sp. KMU-117]|uniref:antibiotic biosynthesis monooxygenase family protein n=1 Tax=Palleronia sp. KMU-117 TaxID=3434108 RepID=UPI003D731D2D
MTHPIAAPVDEPVTEPVTESVAEIVTFRLAPGTSEAAFLQAARGTVPFVKAAPGFVARRLSRLDDGTWTDHVVWASMDQAMAAAEALMAEPAAAPFLQAIDMASVTMRHEAILLEME